MFQEFKAFSEKVGKDKFLVQAGGGNTSIKRRHGTLTVKASGTELKYAVTGDIFVDVEIDAVLDSLGDFPSPLVPDGRDPKQLRPSIECQLHAVIPFKIVVHLHMIDAIAILVREDCLTCVEALMGDLPFVWLPYLKPGKELAEAYVEQGRYEPKVILLGNHGVVLCGDTVEEVQSLLDTLSNIFLCTAVPAQAPNDTSLQDVLYLYPDFRLPVNPVLHSLCSIPEIFQYCAGGILYPDQAVYLGGKIHTVGSYALRCMLSRGSTQVFDSNCPRFILFEDLGILVNKGCSSSVEIMLEAHWDVLSKVTPGATLNYLSDSDVAALIDWDAEVYRKHLYDMRQV